MFLDTSGIFCMLDDGEALQSKAISQFQRARRRVVHSIILAEFQALAMTRRLSRQRSMLALRNLMNDPSIEVVRVDAALMNRAIQLIDERPDKGYSLCDALSFVLMRDRNIVEALTTDRHFEQEGFQRLLTD